MAWIPSVTYRTEQDILDRTPNGHCNYNDLNRIEGNCEVLKNFLGVVIQTRTWIRSDFPTVSDFDRIRNNIQSLRDAYYTYPETPNTPENPINTWPKFNDIERILRDIYILYTKNLSAFYHVGELYAGERIGVI